MRLGRIYTRRVAMPEAGIDVLAAAVVAGAGAVERRTRRGLPYAARGSSSISRFFAKQISLHAKRRAHERQSRRIFSG